MDNLLSICQQACYEIGIIPPSSIVGSSDPTAIMLKHYANKALEAVSTEGEWPQLVSAGAITLVSGQEAYSMPSNWYRTVGDTEWNENDLWPLYGPITHEEWMSRKYGTTANPARSRYMMRGRGPKFEIQPTPGSSDAGKIIYFRYVTTDWASTTANSFAQTFTADTTAPVLDDDLVEKDLLWRLKEQKGLEFQRQKAEAEQDRRSRLGDYIGYGRLNLLQRSLNQKLVGIDNIPDKVSGV